MADDVAKLEAVDEMLANSSHRLTDLQNNLTAENQFHTRLSKERKTIASRIKHIEPSANGMSVRQHVFDVLSETEGSMRATDITSKLKDRGVTTASEKGLLPSVLSVLSKRDDLFERLKRGVYQLTENGRNGMGGVGD